MAAHVLAELACGSNAPQLEEIPEDPCCFAIFEFLQMVRGEHEILLPLQNESFVQYFLKQISDANDLVKDLDNALDWFIRDPIQRMQMEIKVGNIPYRTFFRTQEDLVKPFYLEGIVNQYVQYLSSLKEALPNASLMELVKEKFGEDVFEKIFNRDVSEETRVIFNKVIDLARRAPPQYKDLVTLKLLEFFILINQRIIGLVNEKMVEAFNKRLPKDPDFLFQASDRGNVYALQVLSPVCETVLCKGTLPLSIQKKLQFYRIKPQEPAKITYVCKIPSLKEIGRPDGENCPIITLLRPTFSPTANVVLMKCLAGPVREASQEGIQEGLVLLAGTLKINASDHLIEELELSDLCNICEQHCVQAYALEKRLALLKEIEVIPQEVLSAIEKARKEVMNQLHAVYKKIFKKYSNQPRQAAESVRFESFKNRVKELFPKF